jgi:hypothetical protein
MLGLEGSRVAHWTSLVRPSLDWSWKYPLYVLSPTHQTYYGEFGATYSSMSFSIFGFICLASFWPVS